MAKMKNRIALYFGADAAAAKEQAEGLRDEGNTVLLLEAGAWMGDREQVDEVRFTYDVPDGLATRIEKIYQTPFHAGDVADEDEFVTRPDPSGSTDPRNKEVVIPDDWRDLTWQKLTSLANRLRDPDAPMVRNKAEAVEIIEAKETEMRQVRELQEQEEQQKRDAAAEADRRRTEDAARG